MEISSTLSFLISLLVVGGILAGNGETDRADNSADELLLLEPSVLIAVLVRNKAHTLPYFLTWLERLDYPKDRLSIWIRTDHNEDASGEILQAWASDTEARGGYHSVSVETIDSPPFRQSDQKSPLQWTAKRFRHLIRLKEAAMTVAQKIWADYIWFVDADVFITNNQTLRHLVSKKKDLVAPMLTCGGMYSNFWGGMQEDYYYVRSDDYKEILNRKKTGCFVVPMIHSCYLVNLRRRPLPTYDKVNSTIPEDDVILLATNAKSKNIPMEVCNDYQYGFILAPLDDGTQELKQDYDQLLNLRVEIAAYYPSAMEVSPKLSKWLPQEPTISTLGLDKIYVINLERRSDRLEKMKNALRIMGIAYELMDATDGKNLTHEDLKDMGIQQLPEYRDPYSNRLMTLGEIGCFLSHYNIWSHMVKYGVNAAMILEDDIRFEPYFGVQVRRLLEEAGKLSLDWDLMYLGRKRSVNANEPMVQGSEYIAHVDYSYWTLGYILTRRGATKLLDAKPLEKLVPVDEFLPIMFDRSLNQTWKDAFPKRDLLAYTAEPLLLYPTHYVGENGYVSDTEASTILRAPCNTSLCKEEL